jgi:hypothetical protein
MYWYNKISMDFDYNLEKDKYLKKIREIGFKEIIKAVKNKQVIVDIEHFNKVKYPSQRIMVVRINDYAYAVPYVFDKKRKVKFLKTIYANRKLTKIYVKN